MKILIVGAGIVGSIHGWALSVAGHDVTHLVRPGRSARCGAGIPVDILDRRKGKPGRFRGTYSIRTVEDCQAGNGYDLLIAPIHHFALNEVITDILPRLPRTAVLFLTQNWEGTARIDAALPRARYIFGDAKAGGSWEGELLVATIKSMDIGPMDPTGMPLALTVKTCLESAAIKTTIHADDMLHYLWVQFAVSGGLWPAVIKAGSFKAALRDRRAGDEAFAALHECLGLLERRGVRLDAFTELSVYRSSSPFRKIFAMAMMSWMFTFNEYNKRCSAHALKDPREVRAFYYDLLETGRELGHPMPVFSGYKPFIDRFSGA